MEASNLFGASFYLIDYVRKILKYLFHIAYNGANYHGWQRQANTSNTIQEVIETKLETIIGELVPILGCGRTDTGVHASSYYFHIEIEKELDKKQVVYKLNKMVPPDIVVYKCSRVADTFHSRFDAVQRSYTYYLSCLKPIYNQDTCYYYPFAKMLDLEKLNAFAEVLKTTEDFYPFCKFGSDNKTTICKVEECFWAYDQEKKLYTFHIKADRFLRGMIRLIVGAALNIEKGKLKLEDVQMAILKRERLSTDWSVSPKGLFLDGVRYPE